LEKENKRREKIEENLYSFNPKINIDAQNIKRSIQDLFLWDKNKKSKDENVRNNQVFLIILKINRQINKQY